jgi:acetyl esterase
MNKEGTMQGKYPLSVQMQEFVNHCESFFPESIIEQGVEAQRTAYNAMTNSLARPAPKSLHIQDDEIAGVKVRYYCSANDYSLPCSLSELSSAPVVLYAHGGGWYLGGLESHHSFCAAVADICNLTVIAVDYRLAPEHSFPAGLNDCFAVYQALLDESINPVLMGDSAGANLMAALTLKCQQAKLPQAKGQVLIYPALAEPNSLPSHQQLFDAPLLSTQSVKFCIDSYLTQSEQADSNPELVFPLQSRSFEALPPAAIFAAQFDPLLDDAYQYAQRLQKQGGEASCMTIKGLVHGALHGIGRCEEADQLLEVICQQLKGLSE